MLKLPILSLFKITKNLIEYTDKDYSIVIVYVI